VHDAKDTAQEPVAMDMITLIHQTVRAELAVTEDVHFSELICRFHALTAEQMSLQTVTVYVLVATESKVASSVSIKTNPSLRTTD
jgi:urease alpha subunit